MKISLDSQLILNPLTIRQDKKNYIVEDSQTGDFFEMPKICIDAIEMIESNISLREIELTLAQEYPNEKVDLVDFSEQLLELGLIREIDGEKIHTAKKNEQPRGFTWLAPSIAKLFFNKVTIRNLFPSIILINILLIIMNPELMPSYADIFIFDAMTFNILTYTGISLVLILIHEFGHILAIRAHGLPAQLSVGHRLFLVVFETDLSPAWKLEPKQRNVLYLGGIFFDQTVVFLALIGCIILPSGIVGGLLALIVLDIFIKSIYQCCFYMKTDLYYLCENMTGCYNLMENGKQYLSRWLPFVKADSTTQTFQDEGKFVRMYGVFYLVGVLLTLSLFVFYFIPQLVHMYAYTLPELMQPVGNPYFWDALIFVGQTLIMIGLLAYSWHKSRTSRTY
ncbi:peptidase [Virgibacillus kekensis]|uniref:Peptidase n=1 Tax=Virgibacillus kekensis TaxID=202261 RepID=A0ABV9DN89_9BACI